MIIIKILSLSMKLSDVGNSICSLQQVYKYVISISDYNLAGTSGLNRSCFLVLLNVIIDPKFHRVFHLHNVNYFSMIIS